MKKSQVIIFSSVVLIVALVVYFTLFKKEDTQQKAIEELSFDRTLGVSEKNTLKDAIVKDLYKVRELWDNTLERSDLDPETAYTYLITMTSKELLQVEAMLLLFRSTFDSQVPLTSKEETVFKAFFDILKKYQVPENNGLMIITGT